MNVTKFCSLEGPKFKKTKIEQIQVELKSGGWSVEAGDHPSQRGHSTEIRETAELTDFALSSSLSLDNHVTHCKFKDTTSKSKVCV